MPGVNPPPSEYLLQLIGDLQKQVRALATQQQMAFTNASGEVVAQLGLQPTATEYGIGAYAGDTGKQVFYVGDYGFNDGSGRRQTSILMFRDDGTPALQLNDGGLTLNHPHQQALQWYDRSSNTVFADDTVSGVGIARPHIPIYGMVNTNTATWPSTSNTTVTTIASAVFEYQQPRLQFQIYTNVGSGVTGSFGIWVNGTEIATHTNAGSGFQWWTGTVSLPSGLAFGNIYEVDLTGQVTGGTGSVTAQPYMLQGVGS